MIIGERLRAIRQEKNFSQGEIEKRTGLLRCYISRVENGHTVPAIETLEKMARALEIPLYQLFYDGDKPPQVPKVLELQKTERDDWPTGGKSAKYFHRFRNLLGKMDDTDRKLLLIVALKMARKNKS